MPGTHITSGYGVEPYPERVLQAIAPGSRMARHSPISMSNGFGLILWGPDGYYISSRL